MQQIQQNWKEDKNLTSKSASKIAFTPSGFHHYHSFIWFYCSNYLQIKTANIWIVILNWTNNQYKSPTTITRVQMQWIHCVCKTTHFVQQSSILHIVFKEFSQHSLIEKLVCLSSKARRLSTVTFCCTILKTFLNTL